MTALIGGSVLLIAGATIALVLGWVSASSSLIWTSIVASAGAAVMLALGYYRSRAVVQRTPSSGKPPPTASAPSAQGEVVAIAERKRFHRSDCRYASVKGAETMTREAAVRRGYDPCGVCKP